VATDHANPKVVELLLAKGAVFPVELGVQGFDPADFMERLRSEELWLIWPLVGERQRYRTETARPKTYRF
jgi:hypothetical protein